MKKTDKTRLIKTGSQRQRFVFKKFNKQLISMVGVSFLLLGNYALVPIQVFAGETLVGSTSGVIPEDSQLSTLKISDPLTQIEPVQDVPKIEETEPSAKEVEQITESTVENSEEEAQVSQKDSQSEVSEWVAEESNGYMVISAYTGDGVNIIVPSQINDMPVQINLATAIGNKLRTTTRTFEIEESKDGLNPVKLMGTFYNLFRDNKVITTAAFADADTTAISDMERMFYGCSALVRLDASIWNTQNVRDMSFMFNDCNNLTSLDVSNWNVQNVRDMSYMFYRCSNITSLDVSNWNTENLQRTDAMFINCSSLISLDVSNWDIKNVLSLTGMFADCSNLTNLDVSNWDTRNVQRMGSMFAGCSSLTSLDLSNWNTRNVQFMAYMFADCSNLTNLNVSNWDIRNVQLMGSMFAGCSSLTSLDLSNWSTESIENIENMFLGCNNLIELKLSEPFQLDSIQQLRELSSSENEGKTNYHWVKDDAVEIYDSTTQLIEEHNSLSDGGVHVYTIQKSHEVSFVTNNEDDQLPAQKILEGDFAQDPDYTGTKDHHQLESWMLDGQKFNFEQMEISAPITLIAKWRLNQYTVRFNENGGTGTMVSQTLSYDEEQPLSKNTFERTGYSFKGWSTEQDGKDGEDFADQVEVKNISMIDGEIIDLYAQWEVNQYNIKFDSNGGSGELTPQKMTYDLAENLTENNFTRKGYRFTGWNTQADGKGDSYSDKQEVENLVAEPNGSITLFAQWNITKYNVTFDSAGGSAISDQNYTIETGITEFATPTRKGFTFSGWYDGKTKVEAIGAGETGNRTLTAKWEANQYNIKFDSNGGSGELDP
ncbi:BspA family leucine-rich repeat surface protein [Enterococcus xiangfangensis]|uniref:BspA family leucine-rich repeat surface protein n=1 Tax=Enterococcus xiangfangensis TaxID=1296537 RepID=UPI0010F6F005|nr:BspA family leucine-rich repeat surface protein [Enterococcus xiangfangensis]MBM7710616.1 putative repeat protein (TIGR02543 family) [Enterococcus xiangfangensis]